MYYTTGAVTTAENGPRALEVLGLGDHQRNAMDANVSDSMFKA